MAVVVLMFLNAIRVAEGFSTELTWWGRLSIRVLVAVVRFMIEAVPELTKTGRAAEPACDGSAETARPFSFHPPAEQQACFWELLH